MSSNSSPPWMRLIWVVGAALLLAAISSQLWGRLLAPNELGFLTLQFLSCVIAGLLGLRLEARRRDADDQVRNRPPRRTRRSGGRAQETREAASKGESRTGPKASGDASDDPLEVEQRSSRPVPVRNPTHELSEGVLKFYQLDNQYGFIEREGESDVYFGAEGIAEGVDPSDLSRSIKVTFWIGPGRRGPAAYDVRPGGDTAED